MGTFFYYGCLNKPRSNRTQKLQTLAGKGTQTPDKNNTSLPRHFAKSLAVNQSLKAY